MPPNSNGFIPRIVKPGDAIRAADWNDLQRSVSESLGSGRPERGDGVGNNNVVSVKNSTGADITEKYRCFALGDARFSPLTKKYRLPDVVFDLVAYSAGKPLAVVLEPMAADKLGYAVIYGPTLIEVTGAGSTSDRTGSPNSTGQIVPGSGDAMQFLQARPTGGGVVLGLIGGAGASLKVRIFRTPSGGIAANSSATCDELNEARTAVIGSAVIYTQKNSIVPGGVDILAMSSGTRLWMVEPNCPTEILEP
ncbi:MAG: hypothetical protein U0930_20055 [Pirellulales bacterium]